MVEGVESKGYNNQNEAKVQEEVLYLYTVEQLTVKQIALRRQKTISSVYKILKKLKEKGHLGRVENRGLKKYTHISKKNKNWRFHGLHFVIKPYYFYPRYEKIRKDKGNYGIPYGDWTIKLHYDMVEVQLMPLKDFQNPDKWECLRMALDSFNKVLREVSERYGFMAWKEKKANIRMVNHHLSKNPSAFADAREGKYLSVTGHDGKLWFTIDKSKGAEHEYRHPDRSISDSERVEPYLNDMLYNQPPTMSELMKTVSRIVELHRETMEINKETAAGLNFIIQLIRPRLDEEPKDKKLANYFG